LSIAGKTQVGVSGNHIMGVVRLQSFCAQANLRIATCIAAMMVIFVTPELHLVSIKEEDTVVKAVF
jgi:hypothetical protein